MRKATYFIPQNVLHFKNYLPKNSQLLVSEITDQIEKVKCLVDCPLTQGKRSLLDSARTQICINSRKHYLQMMSESQDKFTN